MSALDRRDDVAVAALRAPLQPSLREAPADPGAQAPAVPGVQATAVPAARAPARSRLPVAVAAAALLSAMEALALLAAGLTGFDGAVSSMHRPPGPVLAAGLGVLATWIVLCAAGGAALLEATGRRLLRAVAFAEFGVVGLLAGSTLVTPRAAVGLPLATAGLALLVPAGKLLLAATPATGQWLAQGPKPVERRPDPVARHRGLCAATLVAIGLALTAVTLVAPAATPPGSVSPTVAGGH